MKQMSDAELLVVLGNILGLLFVFYMIYSTFTGQ
jgi:formate/nitrite transporter FocA (FNT family)